LEITLASSDFDPLAYIENAFLDKKPEPQSPNELRVDIPDFNAYLSADPPKRSSKRFKKTEMRAPRPRRSGAVARPNGIDPELQEVWRALPKNVEFLVNYFNDEATKNYYRGEFKETRSELIQRLLDPELTLEDTSRLLGVVPATIRRYTNRGWLQCHRTTGGQRRFRLSNVVQFVEIHGRFPEE
jgi:hypothetical protein